MIAPGRLCQISFWIISPDSTAATELWKELAALEGYARGPVRLHYRILERFRAEQR
jgi:hypothetical protein